MDPNLWNERYAAGELPWDVGYPDPVLVEAVATGVLNPGRVLEIGCGTGTNAVWLAERGFEVVGLDFAERAVARARERAQASGVGAVFAVANVLEDPIVGGPFDLAYDRGCFHVFDESADQARCAEQVAGALRVGGLWLSVLGSTEGPARESGPPRRSAREIVAAIEPYLEIRELSGVRFEREGPLSVDAWRCLSRKRAAPAQPSSRLDGGGRRGA